MNHTSIKVNSNQVMLTMATILGLIIIYAINNPLLHLLVVWGIVIYAIALVDFDVVHPYFWFSGTCALYNTAYTISYVFGYDRTAGYSPMNSFYALLALGVVLLIVTPKKVERISENNYRDISVFFNERAYMLFALISMGAALILRMRGYAGKREMQQQGDTFYYLGVNVIRWMMVFMVILMVNNRCEDNKKNIKYVIVSVGTSLMMGLFTGERDIILRVVLLLVCTLFYYNKLKRRHILILIPAGILLMMASVYFKYYFLRGYSTVASLTGANWLAQFLNSDFGATGRNTQYLLNNQWTKGYYGISLFISELIRGIVPGDFINPSRWYNYNVYPGSFKGQAFTYVGFGYVIGGTLGVLLVHIILGFFIKWLYKKSNLSKYWLVYYLYSITIVMGCFRQTINTVVNISLKSVLLAVLLSMFVSKMTLRKQRARGGSVNASD